MEDKKDKFFVSVVLINTSGQVLLGRRKEDGIYTMPGGGAEEGETPEQAAVREVFEESGIGVRPEDLRPLSVEETPRGYKIHKFWALVPYSSKATTKLDPDQEVSEWRWLDRSDFPEEMSSEKNKNRLKTATEGLMAYYGIKKSLLDKLSKGGEGSGQKGHITNKPQMPMRNMKVDDLAQHLKDHVKKLKQGGVFAEGGRTSSGKPMMNDIDQARAHGYTSEDHRDTMNAHYNAAEKLAQMRSKFEMAKKPIPKELEEMIKHHMKQVRVHSAASTRIEDRQKKNMKKSLLEKLSKSVTSMGNDDGLEIRTEAYAEERREALKSGWLERLHNAMEGFEYGDMPREIGLDKGMLSLVKVDDGVYTGYVKIIKPVLNEDTDLIEDMEDNAKVRIERQTLPTLVNFLMAKEFISPIQPQQEDSPVAAIDVPCEVEVLPKPQEVVLEPSPMDKRLRMLTLLDKLING